MNLIHVKPFETYILNNHIPQPVHLELRVMHISTDRMTRYIKVYLQGHEVTQMVANIVEFRVSRSKNPKLRGSLIVRGCGYDIGMDIQNRVHIAFKQAGSKVHISEYDYKG